MKTQINKTPLKIYPKVNEDIVDLDRWNAKVGNISSQDGSFDELVSKFRSFYREAHPLLFSFVVKQVWLEQQFTYNGNRRTRRMANHSVMDIAYGQFTKVAVGISHRVITTGQYFNPVATYLPDFFPEFLFSDPFKNPEKYQYPYKHITLDHLVFVHQMENRLDILEEADRRSMSYSEFISWAHNWAMCYNEDVEDTYELCGGNFNWYYIRNKKLPPFWHNKKINFNVK